MILESNSCTSMLQGRTLTTSHPLKLKYQKHRSKVVVIKKPCGTKTRFYYDGFLISERDVVRPVASCMRLLDDALHHTESDCGAISLN